jgi:hypothetical protein
MRQPARVAWLPRRRRTITNSEATMMLYSNYPIPVQRWIDARGGLTPQMIFLRGKQLQAMYQPCHSMRHEFAGT